MTVGRTLFVGSSHGIFVGTEDVVIIPGSVLSGFLRCSVSMLNEPLNRWSGDAWCRHLQEPGFGSSNHTQLFKKLGAVGPGVSPAASSTQVLYFYMGAM